MDDLTTIAAVKSYGGLAASVDDELLQSLVSSYSQWVRSWCNRDFTINTYDLWRDGYGTRTIMVPQWPITAVNLIETDGRAIDASPSWGARGYRFSERSITLDGGACFSFGMQNIHINYTAGYAEVPFDITQAVNELVLLRYKLRTMVEWSSKSLAGETVSLNTKDMPASVATILRQYASVVPV